MMIIPRIPFYIQILFAFCLELLLLLFIDKSMFYPVRICYLSLMLFSSLNLKMHSFSMLFLMMSSHIHGYSINLDLLVMACIMLMLHLYKENLHKNFIISFFTVSILFLLTIVFDLGLKLTISDILANILLVTIVIWYMRGSMKDNRISFNL